jgi:uncharacterized protein
MNARTYGKAGVKVAMLGFGVARLPETKRRRFNIELGVPVLRRAIDLGVNYIDSAQAYGAGSSEVVVGQAIKGYDRSKLYLTTKIAVDSEEQSRASSWRKRLELSLRRFDTPYIDFLFMHALIWKSFSEYVSKPGRALDEMRKAQAEGLIRHVCFSSHDEPQNILQLIDTGEFEGILVQYNCLDVHNRDVVAHAAEKGLGVAIMGPLTAGNFVAPGNAEILPHVPNANRPEMGLGFVWNNPNVTVVLSGMSSVEQVEQNVAAAERFSHLTKAERAKWDKFYRAQQRLADEYCTYCGACLPCPQRVNIPENLRFMNWRQVWGVEKPAKDAYARLTGRTRWEPWGKVNGRKASACNDCGECEPRCPLHIPIMQQLHDVAQALGQ